MGSSQCTYLHVPHTHPEQVRPEQVRPAGSMSGSGEEEVNVFPSGMKEEEPAGVHLSWLTRVDS